MIHAFRAPRLGDFRLNSKTIQFSRSGACAFLESLLSRSSRILCWGPVEKPRTGKPTCKRVRLLGTLCMSEQATWQIYPIHAPVQASPTLPLNTMSQLLKPVQSHHNNLHPSLLSTTPRQILTLTHVGSCSCSHVYNRSINQSTNQS